MPDTQLVKVNYNSVVPKTRLKKLNNFYLFGKRTLDICGALVGVLFLGLTLIFISFIYLFGENKGPIFFKQKRVGKNGKVFYIYKYRSMVVNAEEKLKTNKKLYSKYIANNYKLEPEEDPRITKLGAFLRKTSIDEIPQFINVLKGEMSLVGPRPVVEEELKEYEYKQHELLSVKPGITGYWAASGRSEVIYPERVDLELYYVYNQSFLFDIKILMLTIINVALRKGAY
ncbi:sugar transferase [Gottfriedia acidiceleris]